MYVSIVAPTLLSPPPSPSPQTPPSQPPGVFLSREENLKCILGYKNRVSDWTAIERRRESKVSVHG